MSPVAAPAIKRAIKEQLWAALRPHGFVHTAAWLAWRDSPHGLDIVEVQPGKWNAYGDGAPLGFYLNLAVDLHAIPPLYAAAPSAKPPRPEPAACSFRWRLRPAAAAEEDQDLWQVPGDGVGHTAGFAAMAEALAAGALPYFARFADPEALLDGLDGGGDGAPPDLFGRAAARSPARQRDVAYLALALGRWEQAAAAFEQALGYGPWVAQPALRAPLEAGLARARERLGPG